MNLGRYVRTLRESRQLGQMELAAKLGVSSSYLCHLERGRKTRVGRGMIARLKHALALGDAEVAALHALRELASGRISAEGADAETAAMARMLMQGTPGLTDREKVIGRMFIELLTRSHDHIGSEKPP